MSVIVHSSARMQVTDVAYRDVVLNPPEGEPWPDYVKPPMWARGVEVTIRPEEIRFRYVPGVTNGYSHLSWTLEGQRVLKAGQLGKTVRIAFWSQTAETAPDWAVAVVTEALGYLQR